MAVDLEQLLAERGRRAEVEITMPEFTRAFEQELTRLYLEVLNAWNRDAIRRVQQSYAQELQLNDAPEDEVNGITQAMLAALTTFAASWRAWAARGARRHYQTLVARIKRSTRVDVSNMITTQIDPLDLENLLRWNVSLITDITEQSRNRITSILRAGILARTPPEEIAKQIRESTEIAKARARRVAIDQTTKLNSALDAQRIKELGVEGYIWMHSGKAHPRPEHVARDGDFIKFGSRIDRTDAPGIAPFCGCKRKMRLIPEAA